MNMTLSRTGSLNAGQTTLAGRVSLSGVGVHSGEPVTMTLCPAPADKGIVFVLWDGIQGAELPARHGAVGATELCTVLGDPQGLCVATVEHLLAAFSGLGVDNALIEIDGPEVPIMDGSAADYIAAIDRAGIIRSAAPRRFIRVDRPVRVEQGDGYAEFVPYDGRRFEIEIDYESDVIGHQVLAFDLDALSFRRQVSRARTFGFVRDVERLWAAGYALGSSLENSVVIDDGGVVNPDGLRYADEFVRHKALDAIGDLALAGLPILGLYRSYKGGHRLNAGALGALLDDEEAWSIVSAPRTRVHRRIEAPAAVGEGLALSA